MKKIVLLLFISSVLFACRSIKLADLKPSKDNATLLPYLEPVVDVFSFRQIFPNTVSYTPGSSTTQFQTDSNQTIAYSTYTDPQFNYLINESFYQTISYFEQDVKNNICNSLGSKKGTVRCKIIANNEAIRLKALIVPSILSLSALNLLGMPSSFLLNEIELEVEIFDLKSNKIARYTGYGAANVPVSYYYGYSISDARKLARIKAFGNAMTEIKKQITKEYEFINERLK